MKKLYNSLFVIVALLFVGFLSTTAAEISSPTHFIQQDFDVVNYDATIDLSKYPSTAMSGISKISVHWLKNPENELFYFHLRGLSVDSVFYEESKVNTEVIGEQSSATYHYEITVPEGNIDTLANITVYYHGNMTAEYNNRSYKWGGVHYDNTVLYALGVGFYNNYVSATEHWLACYDHPSDKATFKGKFIVPAGYFLASNGNLTSVENLDNGTDTYTWETNIPCATYNLTFALSKFVPMEFGNENLPMTVYCQSKDTTKVKMLFQFLPNMVSAYEKYFGKYPFEKVGYVITPMGSMEHQTMISYSQSLVNKYIGGGSIDNVTAAHELSHQWFGDMVTPYDFRDAWLNEGFAVFCESIWLGEHYDFSAYLKHQGENINNYISGQSGAKYEGVFPLYDFPRKPPSSNYPATIYYKGGAVMGMLRYELGDSLFFGSLRTYLQQNKYANVNTVSFKDIVENYTHKDLTTFFNQWVYDSGWSLLNLDLERMEGEHNYSLAIEQIQDSIHKIFTNVPVEITFSDKNSNSYTKVFTLNDSINKFDVTLDFDCSQLEVNKGNIMRSLVEVNNISIPVSVYENQESIQIKVYPNPSNTKTIIKVPQFHNSAVLKIYNELGELLFQKSFDNKLNNTYILNTTKFKIGSYFIIFIADNRNYFNKFNVIR